MIASRSSSWLQSAVEAIEDDWFFYIFCSAFILILANACGRFATVLAIPVLTLAIGAIVTVVIFLRPEIGLGLFVASIFFEECWLVGGSMTVAKVVGILTLAAWLVRLPFSANRRLVLPPQAWLTALLLAFGLLSVAWAPDDQVVVRRVIMGGGLLGAFVVIVNIVDSPVKLRRVSNVIAMAGLVAAVLALNVYFFGPWYEPGLQRARVVPGQDPNIFAASLIPAFALFLIMVMRRQELVQRGAWGLGYLIITVAVVLSMSRSIMITLGVVGVLAFVLASRKQRVFLLLLALVVGALAFGFSPKMTERLASIVAVETRGEGRLDIWLTALTMISAHPIQGVGLNNLPVVFLEFFRQTSGIQWSFSKGMAPHNIYLGTLAELGVIGFVIFAGILGTTVISAVRARRDFHRETKDPYVRLASDIWLLSLAGLLVQGLFLDIFYWKFFWLGLALVEVVRRLSSREEDLERFEGQGG